MSLKKVISSATSVLVVSISCISVSQAGEYMTSEEIRNLVSGNSLSGVYEGKNFKQNNHSDGITVVYIAGDKVYNIPWIANEKNQYCENWGDWGWKCYKFKQGEGNQIQVSEVGKDKKEPSLWAWHSKFIDINP